MSVRRFTFSHKNKFKDARTELKNKKKQTHWIWFIFPQLKGLGKSEMSDYYGMSGLEEARCFYKNMFLRRNMNCLIDIMLKYENVDLVDVFGELDYKKVQSCMTLFYLATKKKRFKMILDKFYNSCLDKQTMLLLDMR